MTSTDGAAPSAAEPVTVVDPAPEAGATLLEAATAPEAAAVPEEAAAAPEAAAGPEEAADYLGAAIPEAVFVEEPVAAEEADAPAPAPTTINEGKPLEATVDTQAGDASAGAAAAPAPSEEASNAQKVQAACAPIAVLAVAPLAVQQVTAPAEPLAPALLVKDGGKGQGGLNDGGGGTIKVHLLNPFQSLPYQVIG